MLKRLLAVSVFSVGVIFAGEESEVERLKNIIQAQDNYIDSLQTYLALKQQLQNAEAQLVEAGRALEEVRKEKTSLEQLEIETEDADTGKQ